MRRRKRWPDLEAREAAIRRKNRPTKTCVNCGATLPYDRGHFVPPSFGDEGFFVCAASEPRAILGTKT